MSKEVAAAEHRPDTALWPSMANPFSFPRETRNLEFNEKSLIILYIYLLTWLLLPPHLPHQVQTPGCVSSWMDGPIQVLE